MPRFPRAETKLCGSAPRRRRGVQFPLSVLLILVAGSGALPAGCSAGGRAVVHVALLPTALRLARLLTSLASCLIPTLIGLARLVLRGFIASDLRAITLGRTALLTVATLVLPLVVLVLISHLELHGCRRAGRCEQRLLPIVCLGVTHLVPTTAARHLCARAPNSLSDRD